MSHRTNPHHHVFYLLQTALIRSVGIKALLPLLVERKVVPEEDASLYDKQQNGMKILIFYLKNQSFETFLDFVECILLAQEKAPSKVQSVTVVDSIIKALKEFDEKNSTSHAETVVAIQKKYLKTEEEAVSSSASKMSASKMAHMQH